VSSRISSRVVPSAATENACVWPRVKIAEPCVRGATPTSIQMSRISCAARPSGRFLSTAMRLRMISFSSLSKASCTAWRRAVTMPSSVSTCSPSASRTSSSTALVASWRSSLSTTCVAASRASPKRSRSSLAIDSSTCGGVTSTFSLPAWERRSCWAWQRSLIAWWAMSSASRISASAISLAPASTIRMASSVPATTRSSGDSSSHSSSGLTRKFPSASWPMRTAPTGAGKGMSDTISAALAPFMARMSYGCSWSTDMGIETSWVSRRHPLGKSGRRGRSIMRAVSVAFSPARPSRRKKLPGILPAAYMRSSTSTVSGRKSTSRALPAVAVQSTLVSPAVTTTAPDACLAYLPVSNAIEVPPISKETRLAPSVICFLSAAAQALAERRHPAASGWRHGFRTFRCEPAEG
jgi:hypothetical protein